MTTPPLHVALEGPIGVGKTTLPRRLAPALGARLVLERPNEVPFLARFYAEPERWALPTQLAFLLQRVHQAADLADPDLFGHAIVADFTVHKDPLFARLTLSPDELELYQAIYDRLAGRLPRPDVLVYLQAPTDVLLERIRRRGIACEQDIGADYLDRLGALYRGMLSPGDRWRKIADRLIVVDAADVDFVRREEHFQALLAQVQGGGSDLEVFDPAGSGSPARASRGERLQCW